MFKSNKSGNLFKERLNFKVVSNVTSHELVYFLWTIKTGGMCTGVVAQELISMQGTKEARQELGLGSCSCLHGSELQCQCV
jgi:hypothetical protein